MQLRIRSHLMQAACCCLSHQLVRILHLVKLLL